jgi:polysaccharide biosynthesis protein PslF
MLGSVHSRAASRRPNPVGATPPVHTSSGAGAGRGACRHGGAATRPEGPAVTNTFGFLSTYPPTLCGIASFTAALRGALPPDVAGGVVRLVETPGEPRPAGVVGELVAGSPAGCRRAAVELNQYDVALIQHEYGVYGGRDGDDVLRVMAGLTVPAVVVLHTVLLAPTPHQRSVLNRVVARAAAVVTMSETARSRLLAGYDVAPGRVHVIPHGADDHGSVAAASPHRNQRRQILTWGLLGPGKGIEWGIEAMSLLGDLWPEPRYVVAGRTHPKVLAREGESYRHHLVSKAELLGVGDRVRFDSRYLDPVSLRHLVSRAEVVLLPYDSRDQVTSGVLVEAVISRTPVVATRFPHAVELLSGGAGVLVDHEDPVSIAGALRHVLGDRAAASRMASSAGVAAATLGWASVARRYRAVAAGVAHAGTPVVA